MKTQTHTWLYRIVAIALGLSVLSSLIGALILPAKGLDTAYFLVALGLAAIGGLPTVLALLPLKG